MLNLVQQQLVFSVSLNEAGWTLNGVIDEVRQKYGKAWRLSRTWGTEDTLFIEFIKYER